VQNKDTSPAYGVLYLESHMLHYIIIWWFFFCQIEAMLEQVFNVKVIYFKIQLYLVLLLEMLNISKKALNVVVFWNIGTKTIKHTPRVVVFNKIHQMIIGHDLSGSEYGTPYVVAISSFFS
jgi:hypothetical protein